jgi:hypothetical protein
MAQKPRELWSKALRSKKYKQTKGALANQDGHCCLGVACDLAVKAGIIPAPEKSGDKKSYMLIFDKHHIALPEKVRAWLGLRTSTGRVTDFYESLAALNDCGSTFEEIASIIDNEPEGLFVKEK